MDKSEKIWQLYSKMCEDFGDTFILKELVKALSEDEFNEDILYIARMHDYDLEEFGLES